MSEKAPSQASSQEDLDQLPALEESMAPFGMGDLDSEHGVILKDWTAQDFANIYVRFRSHLISHARKFLRDETQAEEVVQDAFLYLMTALPELDSELGVLRFLKWKTKMLCLDLLRSSGYAIEQVAPVEFDGMSSYQDLAEDLERASDASLVYSALAKLSPRHREAIVSSVLLEESNAVSAAKMGLTENGFRQLLHRARRAFRISLVGDANLNGKSVAEILSVAVKNAAAEKSGRSVVAIAAMLAMSLGIAGFSIQSEPLVSESTPNYSLMAPVSPADPERMTKETPSPDSSKFGEETRDETTISDTEDPTPIPLANEVQHSFESSRADVSIDAKENEQGTTLQESSEHPIVAESTTWASTLLTDLSTLPREPVTLAAGTQLEIQLGDNSNLVITFEEDGSGRLAFAMIEGIGDRRGLIAIPTSIYQGIREEADGEESMQIILAGFAVSSLTQSQDAPVIESGYFSEIAIELSVLGPLGGPILTSSKATVSLLTRS